MNKLSISSCLSNTTVSEYKSVVHMKGEVLAFSMYLNQENIQKLLMSLDIQKHIVKTCFLQIFLMKPKHPYIFTQCIIIFIR